MRKRHENYTEKAPRRKHQKIDIACTKEWDGEGQKMRVLTK